MRKQSWGHGAGSCPNSHPTALLKQSALTISLTHETGYESRPPEVKLGKVVSDLLGCLAVKMTGDTLFPVTQEVNQLVKLSDTF